MPVPTDSWLYNPLLLDDINHPRVSRFYRPARWEEFVGRIRATLEDAGRMGHGVVGTHHPEPYIDAQDQVAMLQTNLAVAQALGLWISELRDAFRNGMALNVVLPAIMAPPPEFLLPPGVLD